MGFELILATLLTAPFQFPLEKNYIPYRDVGYQQYGATSLHHTNTYSLTFDDGPHQVLTPKILDLLKRYEVKATFFLVTERMTKETYPLVERILNEGHLIGSHHHVHYNNNKRSKQEFKKLLIQSFAELKEFSIHTGRQIDKFYYRFPYAAYGRHRDYHHLNVIKDVSYQLFGDNCINFAFWDIDSGDWIPKNSSNKVFQTLKANHEGGVQFSYRMHQGKIILQQRVVESPLGGGVILMHDIQKRTPHALKQFLKYAKKSNIRFARLDEVEEFRYDKSCAFL